MTEQGKKCLNDTKELMDHSISHCEKELTKIRAGKASPQMLEGVKVDYYGTMTPIEQVGAINTPEARQIVVQPWEKSMLGAIEKAIINANLGFNPQNTGEIIRINIPPLTEERRKELVKRAKNESENAKIAIRNIRRDANEHAKKLQKDGMAEDEFKTLEKEIQEMTDKYIVKVDALIVEKEKDIMTV